MDFRVLGPLEAVADGRVVALDAAKPRALLAILLLHANEPVASDRLIDDLWAGRPPATAAKVLQTYVSQLRKALGRDVIVTGPGGLRAPRRAGWPRSAPLRAPRGRGARGRAAGRGRAGCERHSRSGAARHSSSSPTSRGRRVRSADSRSFASPRSRIASTRISLSAAHGELVGELERLVAEHPLSERLRGQLMLALYRSGRQADALEAYRSARAALVEELGIEPGPALRRLERAILDQDPELDVASRRLQTPRPPPQAASAIDLVRRPEPGAAGDPRAAGRGDVRLLTLTGAAGTGKDAARRRGDSRPRR